MTDTNDILLQFGTKSGYQGRSTLGLIEGWQLCLETRQIGVKVVYRLGMPLPGIGKLLIHV